MISAQPTNVWTLKNCKFRAWSKENPTKAIAFQTADTNGNNIHPIGNVVMTDSSGFVYSENDMQLPNGCFVEEEAIIEASRDNGRTYPISWIVRNQNSPSRVIAPDDNTELLNTSLGGLWGENLGRKDGRVYFEDIYGSADLIQIPVLDRSKLQAGIIGPDQIEDGSVIVNKLGEEAVKTSNIKDGAVTHSKLADNAVQENNIKNGAVTLNKLTDNISQLLENLSDSIGRLLRFRVANEQFSTDKNNPTKIQKTDFILILPSPYRLRETYISTDDMEPNSFVLLVPRYEEVPDPPSNISNANMDHKFNIDEYTFFSEINQADLGTGGFSQTRFGFIIFKDDAKVISVCPYLANGKWGFK